MPARGIIDQLPAEIREWLEGELLASGFAGYADLTTALNGRLEEHGLELTVAKSTLHRFGQRFEDQVAALKRTTQMAQTIARDLGDDEGAITDAVIRLTQDKLFNIVLEEGLSPAALNKISHAVADLSRAAVMQKKHQIATRSKAEAAAEKVAAVAKKGGLSAEAVDAIRKDILGIAG